MARISSLSYNLEHTHTHGNVRERSLFKCAPAVIISEPGIYSTANQLATDSAIEPVCDVAEMLIYLLLHQDYSCTLFVVVRCTCRKENTSITHEGVSPVSCCDTGTWFLGPTVTRACISNGTLISSSVFAQFMFVPNTYRHTRVTYAPTGRIYPPRAGDAA